MQFQDPAKQKRYERYLELKKKAGSSYRPTITTSEPKSGGIKSFLKDAAGDINEALIGAGDAIAEGLNDAVGSVKQSVAGERNPVKAGFDVAGNLVRGGGDVIGELGLGAAKAVVTDDTEQAVGDFVQEGSENIMKTKFAQGIKSKYDQLTPDQKQDAATVTNLVMGVVDAIGFGVGRGATKLGREVIETGLESTGRAVKNTGNTVMDTGSDVSQRARQSDIVQETRDYTLSNISDVEPDTIKFILNNPDKFEEAKKLGVSRADLAEQTKSKLDQRLDALSDLGSEYDPIRRSGDVVQIPENFVGQQLEGMGFIIKDGKVRANRKSPTRETAEINELQRIYDIWNDGSLLEADEFLNFRSDLADIAKFDRTSGKPKVREDITSSIRAELNKYRDQIDGLEELDNKYSLEIEELNTLKKDLLDGNGELKDVAINRIANAAGKGKDKQLERLKKLDPDIEEKILTLKALEDVEYAMGTKTGTYLKPVIGSALGVASLPILGAGGPIAVGALYLLTQPKMMARYLTFVGKKLKKGKYPELNDIQSKINSGTKLTKKESQLMSKILQDGRLITDFFGGLAGVTTVETLSSVGSQDNL